MTVKLVKPGESQTQGVGYLDDGTMVVVENGRTHLDHMVDLVVTSTLQTSAGRMIFGRFAHEDDAGVPTSRVTETQEASPTDTESSSTRPPAQKKPANGSDDPKPPRQRDSASRRNPRRG